MRKGIMHESKNGRWIIAKGAFTRTSCAWNVQDTYEAKKYRVEAACNGDETIISDGAQALPPYILTTIAKLQRQHEADIEKTIPATSL